MTEKVDLDVIVPNPQARKAVYNAYFLLTLGLGGATAAIAAIGETTPKWLVATIAFVSFIGAGVSGLASANTRAAEVEVKKATTPEEIAADILKD